MYGKGIKYTKIPVLSGLVWTHSPMMGDVSHRLLHLGCSPVLLTTSATDKGMCERRRERRALRFFFLIAMIDHGPQVHDWSSWTSTRFAKRFALLGKRKLSVVQP